MRKKMDSWDILRMFIVHWKVFFSSFCLVCAIGGVFIYATKTNIKFNVDGDILSAEEVGSLMQEQKEALKARNEMLNKGLEVAALKQYGLIIALKSLGTFPVMKKETFEKITLEIINDKFVQKFTSNASIQAIEPHIYMITFFGHNLQNATSATSYITSQLEAHPLIKAIKQNAKSQYDAYIAMSKEIGFSNGGGESNYRAAEAKNVSQSVFIIQEIKEIKEIKETVQTSLKAKILLVMLSALFIGFFSVYFVEFILQNKEKLRLKSIEKNDNFSFKV